MSEQRKKIFFTYSSNDEDVKAFNNLYLHFSVLKDKVELWHKGKILAGSTTATEVESRYNEADATLHLLSINYINDDDCYRMLQKSIADKKVVIPVLISSFDWESDDQLRVLRDKLLPDDDKPINTHPDNNSVYTEIVKNVKRSLLGIQTENKMSGRVFYYVLAAIVFVIGLLAAVLAYNYSGKNLLIAAICVLLFAAIDLLILRHVLFPTTVSALKN